MTAGDNTAPGASEGAPMPSSPSESSSPYPFNATPAASDPDTAALRKMEGESQVQRDKRVKELWQRLDPQDDRELDLKGLKKGLRRIDHPMKNADDMLREIIDIVDVNGDGKIQYEEFRVFVEAAERQLLLLFRSIDRNHDGRLNRAELRAAFQKTGLAVPMRRLDGFFDEIDMNHDGYITFDEWRDFLLFIPTKGSDSPLETAWSYYASTVILNAEGDSMVSDETLEGLGTTGYLLQALFGSIMKLAKPSVAVSSRVGEKEEELQQTPDVQIASPDQELEMHQQPPQPVQQIRKRRRIRPPETAADSDSIAPAPSSSSPTPPSPPPPPLPPDSKEGTVLVVSSKALPHESETGASAPMSSAAASVSPPSGTRAEASKSLTDSKTAAANAMIDERETVAAGGRGHEYEDFEDLGDVDELDEVLDSGKATGSGTKLQRAQRVAGTTRTKKKFKYKQLTQYLPHPGYFLAGALAGGISRTATAPLDRLKVYLLVNTRGGSSGTKAAASAVASGAATGEPATANLRKTGRPIRDAIVNLYRAGGVRTFFAGNGLNVVKIMPETAIKFGSYEAAKRTLAAIEGHGDPLHINSASKFVAGGVAGMIAQFCVYPLDTLKFRLQCETVQGGPTGNALLMQTARRMYETGGVRAAYRGVTMGLVGMFPYSAIDMGTFELLKSTFTRYKARYYGIHEEDAAPGNVVTGIIGATSGAFGATVVYPLNVLRTRLQTQGTVMHPPTYTGIWDVAARTLANEGVRGLYKGLTPNLLKVAPALSITWVVYENSKKALGLP
ncbi:solute carrier family 25 (mitochondrial phosphate transporter), member 23/24/25/41 [Sporothrix schenckii 1099-18]|nr:solute carrier family 25 (mitochondrial phosphate transporter), member 23/24/25/41 [Sporothrix schenckii 1099-18]KJR84109.1 solute carrier family 25 (mitochondrial phosphate transporter), member 23/24/25/41 [Sporothrix schenckii 1099-18]